VFVDTQFVLFATRTANSPIATMPSTRLIDPRTTPAVASPLPPIRPCEALISFLALRPTRIAAIGAMIGQRKNPRMPRMSDAVALPLVSVGCG
jgi:hypothetical protein